MEPSPVDRATALERLCATVQNQNLYDLAKTYGITIRKAGRLNKGWAGQTLERAAGLTLSSRAGKDGADFELKSTTVIPAGSGWAPRETIKITQLNPERLLDEDFEHSALWEKLSRLILVGCFHRDANHCEIVRIASVDTNDGDLKTALRSFWQDVKFTVCAGEITHYKNLGSSDGLLQLRPTGTSNDYSVCPITQESFPSCAFYATKNLIARFLETGVSHREPVAPKMDLY